MSIIWFIFGYFFGLVIWQLVVLWLVAREYIAWYDKEDCQIVGFIWPIGLCCWLVVGVVIFPISFFVDYLEPKLLSLFEKKERD